MIKYSITSQYFDGPVYVTLNGSDSPIIEGGAIDKDFVERLINRSYDLQGKGMSVDLVYAPDFEFLIEKTPHLKLKIISGERPFEEVSETMDGPIKTIRRISEIEEEKIETTF